MIIKCMSEYRQQEYDFVSRTREILDQYEAFQIDEDKKYCDTLFVNCMVGLLIIPKEHWFEHLPEDIIDEEIWGINEDHISFIRSNELKNVKNISTHLRNSISHYRFKILAKDGILDRIQFTDKNSEPTFNAEIPLLNLRKFVLQLSQEFLNEMENQQ